MRIVIAFLLFSTAMADEFDDWLQEVENSLEDKAVTWLRKQINPEGERAPLQLKEDCKNCFKGKILEVGDPKLYVCMSFSVPDSIWLSLDKEMKDYQAIFVMRGLPNNNFRLFAQRIAQLKEKGMNASVLIHPQIFKDYMIKRVPTFIFKDNVVEQQISGAISVRYASELMGGAK